MLLTIVYENALEANRTSPHAAGFEKKISRFFENLSKECQTDLILRKDGKEKEIVLNYETSQEAWALAYKIGDLFADYETKFKEETPLMAEYRSAASAWLKDLGSDHILCRTELFTTPASAERLLQLHTQYPDAMDHDHH
ncbi:MAG: hypothetical protein DYH13_10800 [Alphaproteobacteria bacterium PRO2]|nr:hypothetical protein [Alphaproteobacteria bacterium PRO2]